MDNVEPCNNVKPSISNGRIHSDGTTILGADSKAAIAAIINMTQKISRSRKKHRPIELIITKSEESGNYGAIKFNYNLLNAKEGFCFDSVSKIGTIVLSSPAYERFDISLIGNGAHASKPQDANNPIDGFIWLQKKVKTGIVSNNMIANIGVVKIGSVRNAVPGTVNIEGEMRSISERDIILYKAELKDALKKTLIKFKLSGRLKIARENDGYKVLKNNPTIAHAIKSTLSIRTTPNLINSWAISDANIFNTKGLCCINLGDGVKNAHTTKESISIKDLMRLEQLMHALISGH
jgi:tripeptide aminopeptidase